MSVFTLIVALAAGCAAQTPKEAAPMALEIPAHATFRFHGPMGERVAANVDNWLLRAPLANPGMIEMFRVRDRRPVPQLVPWAGEFIGKYLISAIQACRMSDDPRLRPFVARVIARFISTQAEDGYLGPFPKAERLLGNWDLWGHYHAMLALMMWYEDTGDQAALDCAVRAGDLVCRTFLDAPRRVWDTGSHEMNMTILTALGRLYRHTHQERYLRMMREVEKDWERPPAGDYLRAALAGLDFYRTPKPRWESLHDLQGLVELHRITGDDRYRRAFIQHWTSIRSYDRHPSGGFTTGEQAVGNPYSEGAIETCCTTAWMALTVDMLQLTGDPAAADELEMATWNSMLGSQHPSGRWWTYNTPVDGVREASAHTIVFQARVGTPELNCCSVNAPRGLGMLSEWAVMLSPEGPTVNYYGPCEITTQSPDGTPLVLKQETRYPAEGAVKLTFSPAKATEMTVRVRIPAWSERTQVKVNGTPVPGARAGSYLPLPRTWQPGDVVELVFDMRLRSWSGELSKHGRAAIYRGPLLLAYDQEFNPFDPDAIPALDLARLGEPQPVTASSPFPPLVLLKLRAADGSDLTLCDFATAGACGTHYVAWLPALNGAPAPFYLKRPGDGDRIPAGPALFEWTGYRGEAATGRRFRLEVAADAGFSRLVVTRPGLEGARVILAGIEGARVILAGALQPNATYFWRVVASNAHGETANVLGPRQFTVDPALPRTLKPEDYAEPRRGEHGLIVASPLAGDGQPSFGKLLESADVAAALDRLGRAGHAVAFNGHSSKLRYEVVDFPEEDYTACAWVCPEGPPTDRLQQVFSGWAVGMDDPLRIVITGGEVFARIEAGGGAWSTPGVKLESGRWAHVAAVKHGGTLTLYVDGEAKGSCTVPALVFTSARDVAVGTNPNYGGNECLLGRLSDFAFYAAALTPEQIAGVYRSGKP